MKSLALIAATTLVALTGAAQAQDAAQSGRFGQPASSVCQPLDSACPMVFSARSRT